MKDATNDCKTFDQAENRQMPVHPVFFAVSRRVDYAFKDPNKVYIDTEKYIILS